MIVSLMQICWNLIWSSAIVVATAVLSVQTSLVIWSFSSDLSYQENASTCRTATHWMFFFFFAPFSTSSRDCWVWKSQGISRFRNTQTTPIWHKQPNYSQRHLKFILFYCLIWPLTKTLDLSLHVFKHRASLDICMNEPAHRCSL